MKKLLIVSFAVVILTMVTFTVAVNANLLLNGSFETGPALDYEPGMWANVYPPATSITNWTVIMSSINYKSSAFWECSDGDRSLDLNGEEGPGGVEQTFTTVIGEEYNVSFDIAGNTSTNPLNNTPIKWMRVAAAGDSADFSFDITGKTKAAMGWESHTWSFTAASTSTTLQLYSLDPTTQWGPTLDNVTITIPEPGTLALLSFSGLVILLRKRKK